MTDMFEKAEIEIYHLDMVTDIVATSPEDPEANWRDDPEMVG